MLTFKNRLQFQVHQYTGPFVIVVSCVTTDKPYKPHPHTLVGMDCRKGVCIMRIRDSSVVRFPHMSVQCAEKKDVEGNLTQRQDINVDPFGSECPYWSLYKFHSASFQRSVNALTNISKLDENQILFMLFVFHRGGQYILCFSFLMNSFNKTEAAMFLMQTMLSKDFPFLCPRHSKIGGGALSVTPFRACVRACVRASVRPLSKVGVRSITFEKLHRFHSYLACWYITSKYRSSLIWVTIRGVAGHPCPMVTFSQIYLLGNPANDSEVKCNLYNFCNNMQYLLKGLFNFFQLVFNTVIRT